ncbi:MAG: hypothetical protein HOV76_29320 [Hamadaea sp.]|nr:hypothetical protein [Hamadaea sp.]
MPAATATEWLTAAAIGTGAYLPGALLILGLDHELPHLSHLSPTAALHRAIESGRYDPALITVTNARHSARDATERARRIPRDTAITAAALLMLLTATPEATR